MLRNKVELSHWQVSPNSARGRQVYALWGVQCFSRYLAALRWGSSFLFDLMKISDLRKLVAHGEDSRLQFKADVRNVDALAAEMAAFANSEGGRILIGVGDNDGLDGISRTEVGRINQLSYHGLGSGIKRALDAWRKIDFTDDRDGCLFTATVHRKPVGEITLVAKPPKTSGKILDILKQEEHLTIPELARLIGVTERSIERNIRKLQDQGLLRRIGPAKGGHWEVIE